jgi:hypothetical protein
MAPDQKGNSPKQKENEEDEDIVIGTLKRVLLIIRRLRGLRGVRCRGE